MAMSLYYTHRNDWAQLTRRTCSTIKNDATRRDATRQSELGNSTAIWPFIWFRFVLFVNTKFAIKFSHLMGFSSIDFLFVCHVVIRYQYTCTYVMCSQVIHVHFTRSILESKSGALANSNEIKFQIVISQNKYKYIMVFTNFMGQL